MTTVDDAESLAAELRASELRLRRFVDHAADGFLLSVRGGAFIDVNEAACSALGYTREELLALSVLDIQDGIDAPALDALWDTMVPGEPITIEGRSRRKDGSHFPAEVRVGRVDSGGEQLMLALVRDVTARKEVEAELRQRAEQQAAVAELGRRALAELDTAALMEDAVRLLVTSLRVDRACVLEHKPDGVSPLLRAGVGCGRVEAGQTEARAMIQGRGRPFGMLTIQSDRAHAFTPDDINLLEAVAHVLGAAISREREERLQAHFERSRRVEAVGQLAGRIAHDFNNILGVVLNYAQFALDATESDSELHADIAEIDRAAQRARDLTRELVVFSQQEAFETEIVDLNELIRASESSVRRSIGSEISLVSELSDELWPTRAGAGQVEQILEQLADNARSSMPDGGMLAINTENLAFDEGTLAEGSGTPAGRFVRMTVADTGAGMSEDVAAHAFDLFFTTQALGEGKGVGLATVHGLARQLGGFVRLYSEPGVGTALKVYLPALEALDAPRVVPGAAVADGHGETILVVEDEAAVLRLTLRILSEHGYDVLAADGVDAAIAAWQARASEIDLLLTDVMMPGTSGAALAAQLQGQRPGLPVLFMSGYTGGVVAREGPIVAAAVVEKPFSSDGLLRSVRQALGGRT